jgi:flagellar hook-associated protein 2
MAGTISFGGIGSGIDTEGIIAGLVGVERSALSTTQSKAAAVRSAASSISDVGSALSTLKTALEALDEVKEAQAYKATSSNADVVAVSSNGAARPGVFSIEVSQVAAAQRTYSNTYASNTSELSIEGTLGLSINGDSADITIEATDSLNSIAQKINDAGLNVTATTFYDGSEYRLQIRGLETGAANAITMTQTGFDLGLNVADNTVQAAQNTLAKIDGFDVSSATNQINGAIEGVTIAVKGETTQKETIEIASDPEELAKTIQNFIDGYNAVVKKVHQFAGFGQLEASNSVLAGDSTLRTITDRLSSTLLTTRGNGRYQTLGAIGIELNNDGTLKLNQDKLTAALEDDIDSVNFVLAGDDDTTGGAMDALRDLVEGFTETDGLIDNKVEALNDRADSLTDSIEREEARIDRYEESLRKQFTTMDSQVASYNMQLEYLLSALSGSGTG